MKHTNTVTFELEHYCLAIKFCYYIVNFAALCISKIACH